MNVTATNNMFALWPVDRLNFSNFILTTFVHVGEYAASKAATSQTQTLGASPGRQRTMNKEDIIIPTIFLGVILLTSLVPVVQIILMTLSGGLTAILTIPFDYNESTMKTIGIVSNSILTIIALFLFYKSKDTWTRILTSALVLFSGQGLMLFTIGKILNEDDSYYIYWIVLSGTPVLLTLLVGLFKYQILRTQYRTKT